MNENNILSNLEEIPTEYLDDYEKYENFDDSLDPFQFQQEFFKPTEISSPEYEDDFDVFNYFFLYNQIYFNDKLGFVKLEWSKRMTLCAGIFSLRNSEAVIRLSEPLLKFRSIKEIKETLLHEMIHAWAYIEGFDQSDDRTGHGNHFKLKMYEINKDTGLTITVYHSFHDEVEYHRKHVWSCNGKCRNEPPYFGWVKRAMNRAPSKSDRWWNDHQASCGGEFIKVLNDITTNNKNLKIKNKILNSTSTNSTLDTFVKRKKKN